MDRSLYVAMTGAAQNWAAQAVHSNNLANVNTTGFKADFAQARAMPVFGEVFPSRVYAMTERPSTDTSSGAINQTGNTLDVAVKGQGWVAVQGADGKEAYTRAGDLTVDAEGILRTGAGFPVLGNGGPITVPAASRIDIGESGAVTIQAPGAQANQLSVVDRIKLVKPDEKLLVKGTDGLLRRKDGAEETADPSVRLSTGSVEASNVNAVAEMTSIIELARQFEMQVKFMKDAEGNDEAMARILQV